MSDGGDVNGQQKQVLAWDLPTRLFHWLLALMVLFAWVSWRYSELLGDPSLKLHRWNGQAILILVVWRVLWGVVGSPSSRFSTWLYSPLVALTYALQILRGRTPLYLSHNPLGSYMILALLAAVTGQAVLGLFTVEHNDLTAGPLYRMASEETHKIVGGWHAWLFYWGILTLVATHVVANIWYGAAKKEPLITAMITGKKPPADYLDSKEAAAPARPVLRAIVCLVLSAAMVLGTIYGVLGGKAL